MIGKLSTAKFVAATEQNSPLIHQFVNQFHPSFSLSFLFPKKGDGASEEPKGKRNGEGVKKERKNGANREEEEEETKRAFCETLGPSLSPSPLTDWPFGVPSRRTFTWNGTAEGIATSPSRK